MCKALQVSRSGYYAYISRSESNRSKENKKLLKTIKKIHKESPRIYGSPQITKNLPADQKASRGRVARLMRANGIRSKVTKKYKATTNSNHNLPVADNLLNKNFTADKPNQKQVSDITYIHTKEGLMIHSDRGVQYASNDYQKLLKKYKFICSMSRKGNCYDNTPMESFWGKLKMEWLNDYNFKTRAEAKKAIFEYIELFYNRRRTHSTNGYIPPFMLGEVS